MSAATVEGRREKAGPARSAAAPEDLRAPPGNRLEAPSGDREGQHSIRINARYRICFIWTDSGAEQVEILDYHQPEGRMVRIPTDRTPTHPGEVLLDEFLRPLGLTQRDLAGAIGVPYQRVNEVVRGRRGITPSTALRLGKFFGTTPAFWMNLQLRWDLHHVRRSESGQLDKIAPLPASREAVLR